MLNGSVLLAKATTVSSYADVAVALLTDPSHAAPSRDNSTVLVYTIQPAGAASALPPVFRRPHCEDERSAFDAGVPSSASTTCAFGGTAKGKRLFCAWYRRTSTPGLLVVKSSHTDPRLRPARPEDVLHGLTRAQSARRCRLGCESRADPLRRGMPGSPLAPPVRPPRVRGTRHQQGVSQDGLPRDDVRHCRRSLRLHPPLSLRLPHSRLRARSHAAPSRTRHVAVRCVPRRFHRPLLHQIFARRRRLLRGIDVRQRRRHGLDRPIRIRTIRVKLKYLMSSR